MKTFGPSPHEVACGLYEFVSRRHGELQENLWTHGALLFRGFGVTPVATFETTVRLFTTNLMSENGEHVPVAANSFVYRPVDYDPQQQLLWHNENSFNATWPGIIAFCCGRPAHTGGATTLVASEQLLRRLDASLVEDFRRRQVRYVRRMGLGIGRTWQQVFRTEDRLKVEAACRAQRFDYVWLDEDVLETSCVRPAMTRHPVTGTECWFNQAQHWHVACLDPMLRQDLLDTFGADRMPRECTFGDGAAIADSIMVEILTAYRASEVAVQWQTGDVLIVDNIATAHGRDPYRGERELFVAMGTPHVFGS